MQSHLQNPLIKNFKDNLIMDLSDSNRLSQAIDTLLEQVISRLDVDAAALSLVNINSPQLIFCRGYGFYQGTINNQPFHSWKGLICRVIHKRDIVSVPNIWTESYALVRSVQFKQEGFISYRGIPLSIEGKILGVLEVFHRQETITESVWYSLLRVMAEQASRVIENASLDGK